MDKKNIIIGSVIGIAVLLVLALSSLFLLEEEQQPFPQQNIVDRDQDEPDEEIPDEVPVVTGEITPVYVVFNSHNEENWNLNTESRYLDYREDLLERLHIFEAYGAKLNWQSDYSVLLSMMEYENGDILDETNGKNILRYMVEDLDFSVDPHLHPTEYNYADLAYLIEQLDVEPSGVVGGSIVKECVDGEIVYNDWQEVLEIESDGYIYGSVYPDYKWKPEIMSGAGSGGHWYDLLSSGMWYAGDGEEYAEPQESGQIIHFGTGYPHDATLFGATSSSGAEIFYEDGGYVKELVDKIQSGELPAGKFYSANIGVRDIEVVPGTGAVTNEGLQQVLEELKPYADAGLIKYVTYQEAVEIWQTEYNSEPNQVDISEFSVYDEILEQEESACNSETTRGPRG